MTARSVSSTASAIAFTCRWFSPEHSTKESVNAGVFRRSRTTTSTRFLVERGAYGLRDVAGQPLAPPARRGRFSVFFSAVFFSGAFFSDRFSVFIADLRRLGFYVQTVSQDVGLDRRRHEAADALAGAQPPADVGRRYVGRGRVDRKNRRPARTMRDAAGCSRSLIPGTRSTAAAAVIPDVK